MSWIGNALNIVKSVFNNEGLVQSEPKTDPKPDFQSMTKKQLEAYGRTIGIELDRRLNKKKLIERLEAV